MPEFDPFDKPESPFDWRDVAVRTGWTALAAGLGYAAASLTGVTAWWGPVATTAITSLLVVVRQRAGGS